LNEEADCQGTIPEGACKELDRSTLPEELAGTLDKVVSQLDIITR
jgi:hypothetical protein